MSSVVVRMAAAFALVAIVTVVAVGLAAHWAVESEFGDYLYRARFEPGGKPGEGDPPAAAAPGPGPEVGALPRHSWMRRMMTPEWSGVMAYLVGAPEQRFLDSVRRVLWQVGAVAALAGAVAGVAMATALTRRLHRLSHRALQLGRLAHWTPPSGDEVDRLDAAFSKMEQALGEKESQRRQLLADVAHELKTPLAVVQANLEAMLEGVSHPTPQRIAAMHDQVTMLGRLVNDLRDLSMADAGELVTQRSPVDLADLVETAADLWRPRVEELGAHLVTERDPAAEFRTMGDRDRLGQVLGNLLSNAVRHLPPSGGEVRIALRSEGSGSKERSGRRAAIVVEDNGPGIPAGDLDRIFDHFYRADPARSRAAGGSGIGLALVRSFVEAHGGSVQAENRPEGGARFVVSLPLGMAATAQHV